MGKDINPGFDQSYTQADTVRTGTSERPQPGVPGLVPGSFLSLCKPEHCVQDTVGAEYHPHLITSKTV